MENYYVLERAIGHLTPSVGRVHAVQLVVGGSAGVILLAVALAFILWPKDFGFIVKNLRCNPMRTALTALATAVFVLILTLVRSLLLLLVTALTEKSNDLRVDVSRRWQMPS